jgi:hypothetical protein
MDQDFKDYILFKVGSYWIYNDSASGGIDSVYLYSQEIDMYKGNDKVRYNMEEFSERLYSTINDTLMGGAGNGDQNFPYVYRQVPSKNFINFIPYYFSTGTDTINTEFDNLTYVNYYDSIKISSSWFKAAKCFSNMDSSFPYNPKKIYLSQHIGIIRKELFNGQIWDLIRYHVSQ